MRLKNFLFQTLFCAFALVSCAPEAQPEKEPSLTLTPAETQFTVPATQSTITVNVLSTRKWKVSSSEGWLTFSVDGKDATDVAIEPSDSPVAVEISVLPNDGLERSTTVLFNGGTLASKEITIKQEGSASYKTVAELRALLGTQDKMPVPDGFVVKGTVISNASLNDLTSKKSMYIQDATGGVNIYCTADHTFAFGDEIAVDASGVSLELYSGAQELNGQTTDKITKLSSGNTVTPVEISIADFLANKYESRYVTLSDVQVADADLSKNWVMSDAHTSINMVAKGGETFVVRSSKYSSFGSEKVAQGSGKISGIATYYNGTLQLVFAQTSDYAGLTGERFKIAAQTSKIDDVITNTSGSFTVLGRVIAVSGFGFVINDGTQNNLAITKENSGVKIGDLVSVSGTVDKWGTCIRLKDVTVEPTTETIAATPAQDVLAVAPGDIASFNANGSAKRISFEGTLDVSKSGDVVYNNVVFDGLEKPKGSIYSSEDLSAFNGKRIKATGYFNGSTNNYFMMISTSVESSESSFFSVSPTSLSIGAAGGKADFGISASSDLAWTVTSSDATNASVSKASGTGEATVTVTVAENKAFEAREFTITVSTTADVATKSYTVTVKQAAAEDPNAEFVALTNAEICKTLTDLNTNSTTYTTVTYKSASGDWEANSSPTSTNKWVQIRDTKASYLKSPEFSKNIEKIEISTDANKAKMIRTFYAVPSNTTLESSSTSYESTIPTVLSAAYGSATTKGFETAGTAGEVGETVTLTFGSDTKSFMLLTTPKGSTNQTGAAYINSIKVYFKK